MARPLRLSPKTKLREFLRNDMRSAVGRSEKKEWTWKVLKVV